MQAIALIEDYMATERRKRKRKTFLLDPAVIEGVAELARRDGRSENQFLERLLFGVCREAGVIAADEEMIGETRGGTRQTESEKD